MGYHVVGILYSQGNLRSAYDSYEVVAFLLRFSATRYKSMLNKFYAEHAKGRLSESKRHWWNDI